MGAKRRLNGTAKSEQKDRQTDRHTHRHTYGQIDLKKTSAQRADALKMLFAVLNIKVTKTQKKCVKNISTLFKLDKTSVFILL